jgi:glycosyltransferase involved in cell wall biosynthesis
VAEVQRESRKLKVCHVFAGADGGRWVHDQLDALRAHGCEPTALLGGDEGSLVDLCREANIPVKAFSFRIYGWKAVLSFPLRVIRMALWMRKERFDVVQSHIIPSTLFARPAAWLADVPVRLEMSTSPYYMQAPSIRWMEKATAWMETGLIPSCELTGDLYRQAGLPSRLIQPTLYYGPKASRFDPAKAVAEGLREEFGLPAGTPLIGSIAVFYSRCGDSSFIPPETRNRYIKGHTDLIEALPLVRREFPDARLVLIGCGWGPCAAQTEAELKQFVRERGLQDLVFFAGWRPSTPAVLVDLDVSVQASLNENLGGTVESLLMARPTVATRVGGMVDSVVDGETGILVNPGDPGDLARGIVELLRDPGRAAALGKAGRERMLSRFTLETTAPELAQLYRRQRSEARGAWRLHVSLVRLLLGGMVAVPILLRMSVYDVFLLNILPARIRSWKDRFRRAAGKVTARRLPAKSRG